MQGFRYIESVVTLSFDAEKCSGCRVCTVVCPHGVFAMGDDKRAYIADRGACMECGACALNCAWDAISVKPGVGCAEAIIHSWIHGGEPTCGCTVPAVSGNGSGKGAAGPTASGCCGGGKPEEPATAGCCGGSKPEEPSAPGCCSSAAQEPEVYDPRAGAS